MSCYHNTIFYSDADYEGFEPGETLGLEVWHHAGFKTVIIGPDETVEQTAYRYMRETHHFITDDNHTWYVDMAEKPYWTSRLRVVKNENSGYFAFNPWGVSDGPGAHWFNVEFRVATVGMIQAEIAADRRRTQKYLAEAAAQKDTIRGRKRASELRSFAHTSNWVAESAPGERWPNHFLKQEKAA